MSKREQIRMNEFSQTLIGAASSYGAIDALTSSGAMVVVDDDALAGFLDAEGLAVLFFAGGAKRRRESHDVAVALREVLKDYEKGIRVALVGDKASADLKSQFRVVVEPSLVFVLDGAVLEVVPGIRDWAEYAAAFRRYLGNPAREPEGATA